MKKMLQPLQPDIQQGVRIFPVSHEEITDIFATHVGHFINFKDLAMSLVIKNFSLEMRKFRGDFCENFFCH